MNRDRRDPAWWLAAALVAVLILAADGLVLILAAGLCVWLFRTIVG